MDMRMNGMISNLLKGLAGLAFAGMMMCGCARLELDMPVTTYVDPACKEAIRVQFEIGHAEAMDSLGHIDTKSYLTTAGIETLVTNVTLAIYESDGTQAYLGYITSGFNAVDITLRSDRTYNVYAVANMGDKRTALASAISGGTLSSMTYTVDYSSMNSNGIPMAISLMGQTFSNGQNVSIYLQRLLAKINVYLSCDWAEAVITGATVKNVNPTVAPFGEIPASNTNPATLQDIHGTTPGTGTTLSAVFYVPENNKGTVGSVAASTQKTYTNYALSGIRDYATYLEVDVTTSGDYDGAIIYRSYLGSNQTTDFNIARNEIYNWTISYSKENLQTYDWKRDIDGLYYYRAEFTSELSSIYLLNYNKNCTPTLQLKKYSARTGGLVGTVTPTATAARAYESSTGDDLKTSGVAFSNFNVNSSFTADFNGSVAGPVYLEADCSYLGHTYTTGTRHLVHLNGAVRIEFTEDEYFIPNYSNYEYNDYYWEDVLQYTFVTYYDGVYGTGPQGNTYYITGTITNLPANYSMNSIPHYVWDDDESDWGDYTYDELGVLVDVYTSMYDIIEEPYVSATLTVSGRFQSGYHPLVPGTTTINLCNNTAFYRITSPTETITVGESVQLRYIYESYYNGAIYAQNDLTSQWGTTWGIDSSTSGSLTGLSINTGLLTADNTASPGVVTVWAQYSGTRRYKDITVVSSGPVITYTPTRLVVTGDSSVSVGGTTSNYTATLHYNELHDGVIYASDLTADVSTDCTFSSSDTGIATMSGRAATGVAAGTAYISASYTGTYGTYSTDTADRATLTVTGGGGPVITYRMYDITFAANPINVGGSTTATARKQKFVDGVASGEFSSASATWTSNDISVASIVAATGAISGVNAGSTTFVATDTSCESGYQSITSSTFTVNAVVTPSIRFSPWNFSVAYDECVGYSNSLDVTASYENTGDESGFTSDYSNTSNCSAADFYYSNSGATVTFYWTNNNTTGSSRSVDITLTDPVSGASDYIRITQAAYDAPYVTGYEYRNKVVTISASPDHFDAAGGDYTLTASATWEYREIYNIGDPGDWTPDSGIPHVEGSATGFTSVNTNTTSTGGSASLNTGGARSVTYTATYTFPDGSEGSDSCDVNQDADAVSSTEYRNKSVTISASPSSLPAAGDDYTLTASATWEYRYVYVSGHIGDWIPSGIQAPHIEGFATGFTSVNTDATSVPCSASENNGGARSVIYTATYTFPDGSDGSDSVEVEQAAYVPTTIYKAVTSVSSSSIDVGGSTSASASLYRSTNGGSSWSYVSNITSSGFYQESGSGNVSISGSTITGTSPGSATIRSNYSADVYEDASLTVTNPTVSSIYISDPAGYQGIYGHSEAHYPICYVTLSNGETYNSDTNWQLFSWDISGGLSFIDDRDGSFNLNGDVGNYTLSCDFSNGVASGSTSATYTIIDDSYVLLSASLEIYSAALTQVTYRIACSVQSEITGISTTIYVYDSVVEHYGLVLTPNYESASGGLWGPCSNVVPGGTHIRAYVNGVFAGEQQY